MLQNLIIIIQNLLLFSLNICILVPLNESFFSYDVNKWSILKLFSLIYTKEHTVYNKLIDSVFQFVYTVWSFVLMRENQIFNIGVVTQLQNLPKMNFFRSVFKLINILQVYLTLPIGRFSTTNHLILPYKYNTAFVQWAKLD